jgi:hypothetical protein
MSLEVRLEECLVWVALLLEVCRTLAVLQDSKAVQQPQLVRLSILL